MRILFLFLTLASSLCAETKILAFAGSTREDSCNKKLVREAAGIARQMGATVTLIDLKDYPIPFYDADLETKEGMTPNAKRLRALMIESNAIIIASPEYNGSIPGLLKNALDWASRNEQGNPSRDAYSGKKFAIMSASPGSGGGARALAHLRTIIQNIGGEVIPEQVTVANCNGAFNAQGHLENPALKQALQAEIQQLLPAKTIKKS